MSFYFNLHNSQNLITQIVIKYDSKKQTCARFNSKDYSISR